MGIGLLKPVVFLSFLIAFFKSQYIQHNFHSATYILCNDYFC
ncbi:DUF1240 domain-containing protein [Erwinia psidii]|uniref:DUF1240 domain-containing protein n=1 Tax=Erwinia psidii TaxID=69224 RepID=A0A3N6SKA2_9GAMM|nr:DUF1240 domain-containing protein [Erwinia psidii]MCX8962355.1 DUF1240 domain-containing protein [Erwinia psidii]MCX8965139.1 DUF1240 domain-containing protein [Erwinia psidii]RQM38056.1 DUF1240 domain-containing protein [Erwinia psidii]